MRLLEQIRANQLAVISLVVAVTALMYTTWRNEATEANRNIREAGFEMIVHIGELQRISYLAHYDRDTVGGNPRKGWTEVLVLKDLAMLMPGDVESSAGRLADAWEANWSGLGTERSSVEAIDDAIDDLRMSILEELERLD